MTAVPVKQRMTAEEFLARPVGDGARRQELVEGAVVVNEPTVLHNVVQKNLVVARDTWVRAGERLGPVLTPLDARLDDRKRLRAGCLVVLGLKPGRRPLRPTHRRANTIARPARLGSDHTR